jgi:hypothetical protein
MARNLEERPQGHHWGPSSLAAVVVASAPVEALTGPLRSWVAVTAQALDNNSLDSVRRGLLTKRVENEAGSNGFESESEFMVAFAPIIKALWPE